MTCSEFLKELTDYLDGVIDAPTRAELEEHLHWCHNCYVVLSTTQRTIQIYRESHLYEDVASVGSYVILSEWERKEDFDAFLHSDAFKSAVAWGRAEILRSRPKHKVYTND